MASLRQTGLAMALALGAAAPAMAQERMVGSARGLEVTGAVATVPRPDSSIMLKRAVVAPGIERIEGLRWAQDTVVVHRAPRGPLILTLLGAASLLTGLIANKDALTVAGAGVMAIGLYLSIR